MRDAISSNDSVFLYASIVSCASRSILRSTPDIISRLIVRTLALSAIENHATVVAVTATSASNSNKIDVRTRERIESDCFCEFLSFIICLLSGRKYHKRPDTNPPHCE